MATDLTSYLKSMGCRVPEWHVQAIMFHGRPLTCHQAAIVSWFHARHRV